MERTYEIYLRKKWKEAENLSCKCGCSDNKVVIAMFNKMTQPYHYWYKGNK